MRASFGPHRLTLGWGGAILLHRYETKVEKVETAQVPPYPRKCEWSIVKPSLLSREYQWICVRDGQVMARISRYGWESVYSVYEPPECLISKFTDLDVAKHCAEKALSAR